MRNAQIRNFDKTFFICEEGTVMFDNVHVSNGHLTNNKDDVLLMVNAILFDIYSGSITFQDSVLEDMSS